MTTSTLVLPVADVQDYARHADPRQTRRYDRARGALDRNPTYIVATYLAGATGAR
jgi:integrase/recombinase XerD